MSRDVKCRICGQPVDERCPLMTVVEEDGEEVAYCCEQIYRRYEKEL